MNQKKRSVVQRAIGWLLFLSLVGSIIFAGIKVAVTPENPAELPEGSRLRSDYTLMLIQCALGLLVMFLPSILERRLSLDIPNYMYVLYFLFLYGAIYLGEVRHFYYTIPHWDTILHGFSAMMLGALGFSLVSILNDSPHTVMNLSPRFVGLFAFCFALTAGAVWEIYEFSFDGVLGLNMQKFRLEGGADLIGRAALADTMKDIITDAIGALVVSVLGAMTIRKRRMAETAEEA